MSRFILVLIILMAGAWLQPAMAACTVSTASINLGGRTSFDAQTADSQAGSGSSGLSCTGLGLLSSQYIYTTISSITPLTHAPSGDTINFSVSSTAGGAALPIGTVSGNLAQLQLLSLGSGGNVNMFVQLAAAGNVSAGTYTGTINLRWHYATCGSLDAIGVCVGDWDRTAGINQNCVILLVRLCTLDTGTLPGAGSPTTITVTLTITPDCRFDANEVNFGSAPFVSSFNPVSGELRIRCTKGSTFTVGLGDGLAHNGRRRMSNGAHRLEYDLFRPGNTVWNATTQRVQQLTPAGGLTAQLFPFEARIYPDQTTPIPGTYTDTVIIDVQF